MAACTYWYYVEYMECLLTRMFDRETFVTARSGIKYVHTMHNWMHRSAFKGPPARPALILSLLCFGLTSFLMSRSTSSLFFELRGERLPSDLLRRFIWTRGARCFIRIGTAASGTAAYDSQSIAADLFALLYCVPVGHSAVEN